MTSSSHGAAAESLGAPPLPGFGGAAPSERPPASVVMDPEVPWSRHCFAAAAEALASVSGRCDAPSSGHRARFCCSAVPAVSCFSFMSSNAMINNFVCKEFFSCFKLSLQDDMKVLGQRHNTLPSEGQSARQDAGRSCAERPPEGSGARLRAQCRPHLQLQILLWPHVRKAKAKKAKKQTKHPDEMKSNDIFYLTNIISKSYHFDMQSA